jgi:hypothetical protein
MDTNEIETGGRHGPAPGRSWRKSWLATGALAAGLAIGAAGIAGAATGSGSGISSDSSGTASSAPAAPGYGQPPSRAQDPATMPNGPGETLLTGDNATKAKAAALAAVPGATVIRVETDSSGAGTYEAHLKKSDGSQVTVLMDSSFTVTSTVDGFGPGGPGGPHGGPGRPGGSDSASSSSSATTN